MLRLTKNTAGVTWAPVARGISYSRSAGTTPDLFQEAIHFSPRGSGGLGAQAGNRDGRRGIGEAEGAIDGPAFRQGHRQRGIECVAGGRGIADLHREGGQMPVAGIVVMEAPLIAELQND